MPTAILERRTRIEYAGRTNSGTALERGVDSWHLTEVGAEDGDRAKLDELGLWRTGSVTRPPTRRLEGTVEEIRRAAFVIAGNNPVSERWTPRTSQDAEDDRAVGYALVTWANYVRTQVSPAKRGGYDPTPERVAARLNLPAGRVAAAMSRLDARRQADALPADFGPRLKALRDAHPMTARELAELTGVSPAAVYALENGTSRPTWDTVQAIATALGVAADVFRDPA